MSSASPVSFPCGCEWPGSVWPEFPCKFFQFPAPDPRHYDLREVWHDVAKTPDCRRRARGRELFQEPGNINERDSDLPFGDQHARARTAAAFRIGTVVNYPQRNETLDFRVQLESKYASKGRTPAQAYVDMDGEVAWIQEYHRYRVNGCDHDTATRNALAQVDGAAPPQVCAVRFFPETAIYPSREDSVDFRRQLGAKYQAMGRSAQSTVDAEGAGIWISEYLRYRTSGCDHASSVQKTMAQVDGAPASATCLVTCAYYVSPASVSTPSGGGAFSVELVRTSGTCEWVAVSEAPWVALTPPLTGGDRSRVSFLVAPNSGGSRSGTVRVNYPGGAVFFEVRQNGLSYNLELPVLRSRGLLESHDRVPDQDHQLGVHVDGGGHRAACVHCELRLAGRLHVWWDEVQDAERRVAHLPAHRILRSLVRRRLGGADFREADGDRYARQHGDALLGTGIPAGAAVEDLSLPVAGRSSAFELVPAVTRADDVPGARLRLRGSSHMRCIGAVNPSGATERLG